jgi:hypothetical protein
VELHGGGGATVTAAAGEGGAERGAVETTADGIEGKATKEGRTRSSMKFCPSLRGGRMRRNGVGHGAIARASKKADDGKGAVDDDDVDHDGAIDALETMLTAVLDFATIDAHESERAAALLDGLRDTDVAREASGHGLVVNYGRLYR